MLGAELPFSVSVARRGGRHPMGAPTVAVGAARRLRCASRSALARRNSLHSLRSLRSDNRRESEVEARATRVPSALLRCSPPHKSPPPGTAHRAVALVVFGHACHGGAGKAAVGCAPAATLRGAEQASPDTTSPVDWSCLASGQSARTGAACKARAHGRARAARASISDSRRLFERSERSERSEFRRGPCDRAAQGSRPAGPTAVHERRRIPGRGFASLGLRTAEAGSPRPPRHDKTS